MFKVFSRDVFIGAAAAGVIISGMAVAQTAPTSPAPSSPPSTVRQMAPSAFASGPSGVTPEQMMQAIYSSGFATGQQVQAALAAKQKELDDKDALIKQKDEQIGALKALLPPEQAAKIPTPPPPPAAATAPAGPHAMKPASLDKK